MIHTPLNIKNFSKYPVNDTYHPSVVYVKEGWNGHTFWMAQTPYSEADIEPYRDRYELPCVLFSDDGVKWTPIPNNPIDDLSDKDIEAHNYLSDPHLVLVNGKLELYYRYTILENKQLIGNKTQLLRKTSSNGVDWSEREVLADLRNAEDIEIWGEQIISPAIVWRDNQYYCWYVDASSYIIDRHIRLTSSNDGIHWSKNVLCELMDLKVIPWHLDVQYYDDKYQLLLFDINSQVLAHYISNDGLHFTNGQILLRPSHKLYDFNSESLYRASSIKVGDVKYVFISGHNGKRCSIGLWKTIDFERLTAVNGMEICEYILNYRIVQLYCQSLNINIIKPHLRKIKGIYKKIIRHKTFEQQNA